MELDLSSLFGKFAGREVPMTETIEEVSGHKYNVVNLADPNDPTVAEMKKTAKDNGLRLRLWWPGLMGTMDYRTDRVNAHIGKENDGKWRVGSKFNIG